MSKFNEIEPLSDEDLAYYIAVLEVGGPAGSGRNTIGYKMAVELRHLRALGKPAVPKWQPIETAPKDGTAILVHSVRGWIGRVSWHSDDYDSYFEDEHQEFVKAEWLTHWMPLPAAPKEQGHE